MNLVSERKYVIESKIEDEPDWFKGIARAIWTRRVNKMPEGEVLRLYHQAIEWSKPLAWLNGGEK